MLSDVCRHILIRYTKRLRRTRTKSLYEKFLLDSNVYVFCKSGPPIVMRSYWSSITPLISDFSFNKVDFSFNNILTFVYELPFHSSISLKSFRLIWEILTLFCLLLTDHPTPFVFWLHVEENTWVCGMTQQVT